MSDERKQVAKKARLDMGNSAAGPTQIQHSTTAADRLASPILKLDVDCFEELFEWLPLADLRALRQTCKRLKQVVDYFIRTNYPAVKFGFGRIVLYGKKDFSEIKELDSIEVKMIKRAKISVNEMTDGMIDVMKRILPQLEDLDFLNVEFDTSFYESILKWCSNLKYLAIMYTTFKEKNPGEDNHWLKHRLPTIEHLAFIYSRIDDFTELGTFLKLNPNIQTFSVNCDVLKSIYDCFFGSNIEIDQLNVLVYSNGVHNFNMLNQLYERGFHKRLHLYVYCVVDQAEMDLIASTRGMEKLYFDETESNAPITLPLMPDLRELCLRDYDKLWNVDMDSMAKNLINLERVCFRQAEIVDIIPFVRYGRKIKEIEVVNLDEGDHFENGVIDLSALNKERKGLAGAQKVTIYVEETIFLSTKFAMTKTDLNLITLKRTEAVEWIHEEIDVC